MGPFRLALNNNETNANDFFLVILVYKYFLKYYVKHYFSVFYVTLFCRILILSSIINTNLKHPKPKKLPTAMSFQ